MKLKGVVRGQTIEFDEPLGLAEGQQVAVSAVEAVDLEKYGFEVIPDGGYKDGGDCLILDLAGSAEEHGLPEDYREWSLAARGNPSVGDPPVRYCHECNYMAHPAHHKCPQCDTDLGKPCLRCGKFRPWSRWAINCPVEHDEVCDYCHPDIHGAKGIGIYNDKQGIEFYWKRAEEYRVEGNQDAALADYYFAIHLAKMREPDFHLLFLYSFRARIHFAMGNTVLAEQDFAEVDALFKAGYYPFTHALIYMHQKRAEMYEELGCPEKADLDRQKAKELNDKVAANSNAE